MEYSSTTISTAYLHILLVIFNNIIRFRLSMDPLTGIITVKEPGTSFDRELVSRHYLTVEARDDLGKGNRNTVQLIVNVNDVNDNAPIFLQNKYEAVLLENEDHFQSPLIVEAFDIDLNGSILSHSRITRRELFARYRLFFPLILSKPRYQEQRSGVRFGVGRIFEEF